MSVPEDPRSRILRATTEAIARHGYGDVDVASIARRAGIDQREFHAHFATVEDSLCAVVAEGTDQLLLRCAQAFAGEEVWRDQLRAVAYTLLAFLLEDDCRARVMVVEVLPAGERAREIRDHGMEVLIELIDQGRGELPDPDSIGRGTAEGIAVVIFGRMHMGIVEGDPAALAAMVPELMYSAVLPYLGVEAAREELRIPPPV